ncbi:MAG: hypothetical protein MZV65_52110 [Chromatiales bacterium]|nr:hypothetical protein [Chromatiales bacterium]
MLNLANTRDANGEYLFAGHNGTTQPFLRTVAGQFTYSRRRRPAFPAARRRASRWRTAIPGVDVFLGDPQRQRRLHHARRCRANTGTGIIDPGTVANPAAYVPDNYRIVFTTAHDLST